MLKVERVEELERAVNEVAEVLNEHIHGHPFSWDVVADLLIILGEYKQRLSEHPAVPVKCPKCNGMGKLPRINDLSRDGGVCPLYQGTGEVNPVPAAPQAEVTEEEQEERDEMLRELNRATLASEAKIRSEFMEPTVSAYTKKLYVWADKIRALLESLPEDNK